MASGILVNIDLGNGLMYDGTKPLPEPMLTYHQRDPLTFNTQDINPQEVLEVYAFKITYTSHRNNERKLASITLADTGLEALV